MENSAPSNLVPSLTNPTTRSETLVSVVEYRKHLGDTTSTDEEIIARLEYLEQLCRDVIKRELQTYVSKSK